MRVHSGFIASCYRIVRGRRVAEKWSHDVNGSMRIQAKPADSPSFAPAPARLVQRKCACGGTPGPDGECAKCRGERLARQSGVLGQRVLSSVPGVVPEVPRSSVQPPGSNTSAEPHSGHDFSRVRVYEPGVDRLQRPDAHRLGLGVMRPERQIPPLSAARAIAARPGSGIRARR